MSEAADEAWPLRPENPARRALRDIGITRVEQLAAHREADLLGLHGVGPKAIRLLRDALERRGLAFAPPEPTSRRPSS